MTHVFRAEKSQSPGDLDPLCIRLDHVDTIRCCSKLSKRFCVVPVLCPFKFSVENLKYFLVTLRKIMQNIISYDNMYTLIVPRRLLERVVLLRRKILPATHSEITNAGFLKPSFQMTTLTLTLTKEVIEKLEKVMPPIIGITAFDADGTDGPSRHLVDMSYVSSASTAASGMWKMYQINTRCLTDPQDMKFHSYRLSRRLTAP